MKKCIVTGLLTVASLMSHAQVFQWSVAVDSVVSEETQAHPRAFLWIPEDCKQVKGIVFTQHNMIEEGILENPVFRKTMATLGFAEVWVTPALSVVFDFNKGAGNDFTRLMQSLADTSGYTELAHAPVIPMGHSALASFPWNFAAWNPGRTLALVSVHGDAPQTNLTGSGRPNPDWGSRNIDGIPALFVMGEYEWLEPRITPAFEYISNHPNSAISLFADAGHGHFDYSEALIRYLCLFITKAAKARLPEIMPIDQPAILKPIQRADGWLMDRWRRDSLPLAKAAPVALYKGMRYQASWVFDEEMAQATEQYYAAARGKINQHIGIIQNGEVIHPQKTHANYQLSFKPLGDGISFGIQAFFADTSRLQAVAEHAGTPLVIDRICGPVQKVNDTTFRISFYRMGFNNPKRSNDIWLLAHNEGDAQYKSIMQQVDLRFPLENKTGKAQTIDFPAIPDQSRHANSYTLNAVSSAGLPVQYYVQEGPAIVKEGKLLFTKIPPRSKYPVKVVVVAWQYGNAHEPKVQTAQWVERVFYIR